MNDSDLDAILRQMAAEHRPQLPSPGLLWFRAQIAQKGRQKERIERPLAVMRGLAGLTCAVLLLVFVAGNWAEIQDAMDHRNWFLLQMLLLTVTASLTSSFKTNPPRSPYLWRCVDRFHEHGSDPSGEACDSDKPGVQTVEVSRRFGREGRFA